MNCRVLVKTVSAQLIRDSPTRCTCHIRRLVSRAASSLCVVASAVCVLAVVVVVLCLCRANNSRHCHPSHNGRDFGSLRLWSASCKKVCYLQCAQHKNTYPMCCGTRKYALEHTQHTHTRRRPSVKKNLSPICGSKFQRRTAPTKEKRVWTLIRINHNPAASAMCRSSGCRIQCGPSVVGGSSAWPINR